MMTEHARFDSLRAQWIRKRAKYDALRASAREKYGDPAYATATERKRMHAADEACWSIERKFFDLLDRISPRNWHSYIPALWIMRELTYEDAVTRGALSVIPPTGYGSDPATVRSFARETFREPDAIAANLTTGAR